jgi:hypothetical protein
MDEPETASSMRIDEVVTAVCRLPIDFRSSRDESPVSLVNRSGYLAVRGEITIARLLACLATQPDWVDAWFAYSEDQRCTPCWFLGETASGYEVALIGGAEPHESTMFDDLLEACATYVHRELESLANNPMLAPQRGLIRATASIKRKTRQSGSSGDIPEH